MTPHQEVIRGEAAKLLLDNPLLKEAFEAVQKNIIRAIGDSAMGDEKTHNRLAIALQLLQQIEKSINIHIETGKLAQIQIEDGFGKKVMNLLK
jgi:hypothetical protein